MLGVLDNKGDKWIKGKPHHVKCVCQTAVSTHTHFKHPVHIEGRGKSLTNLSTYVLNHKMEISKEKKDK